MEIKTPSAKTFSTGNGTATLKWRANFGGDYTNRFLQAQRFIDSECLRLMNPYTPMDTGYMIQSATLGTVIGSGEIEYLAPYARRQYYNNRGGSPRHPSGSKLWFERMKADHKTELMKGAGKYL